MPITQALLWLLQNKKKYTNVDRFEFFGLFFFFHTESLDSNTQVLQRGKIPNKHHKEGEKKKKKKFDEHFPIFTLLAGFVNLFTL